MANGIDRRGFIQLAAAGAALTGNFGAAAARSETATAITRQPAPDFSGDLNTAHPDRNLDPLGRDACIWGGRRRDQFADRGAASMAGPYTLRRRAA